MLKTRLLHPEILATLAASGHFSQVLVADGNFPVAGNRGPNARVVHLNLTPGTLDAITVLDALLEVMPVQAATVDANGALGVLREDRVTTHDFDDRHRRTTSVRESAARNWRGETGNGKFLTKAAGCISAIPILNPIARTSESRAKSSPRQ